MTKLECRIKKAHSQNLLKKNNLDDEAWKKFNKSYIEKQQNYQQKKWEISNLNIFKYF